MSQPYMSQPQEAFQGLDHDTTNELLDIFPHVVFIISFVF